MIFLSSYTQAHALANPQHTAPQQQFVCHLPQSHTQQQQRLTDVKFASRTYAKFAPATRRSLHVSSRRDIGGPDDDDAERTTLRGALLDLNEAANYYSLPPDGGRLRTDAGGCSDRDGGKQNTFRINLSETLTGGFAMEHHISLAWTTALGIIDVAGSATSRRPAYRSTPRL